MATRKVPIQARVNAPVAIPQQQSKLTKKVVTPAPVIRQPVSVQKKKPIQAVAYQDEDMDTQDDFIPDDVLNNVQLPQPGEIARNTISGFKSRGYEPNEPVEDDGDDNVQPQDTEMVDGEAVVDEEEQPVVAPVVKKITVQKGKKIVNNEEPTEEYEQPPPNKKKTVVPKAKKVVNNEADDGDVAPPPKKKAIQKELSVPDSGEPSVGQLEEERPVKPPPDEVLAAMQSQIIYPDQYANFDNSKLSIKAPVTSPKGKGFIMYLLYDGHPLKIQLPELFTNGVTCFTQDDEMRKKGWPYPGEFASEQKTMTFFFEKEWKNCPVTQAFIKILDEVNAFCKKHIQGSYPKEMWSKNTNWNRYEIAPSLNTIKDNRLILSTVVIQKAATEPVDAKKAAKGEKVKSKNGKPEKTSYYKEIAPHFNSEAEMQTWIEKNRPPFYDMVSESEFWQKKQKVSPVIGISWAHVDVTPDKTVGGVYCKIKPAIRVYEVAAPMEKTEYAPVCVVKPYVLGNTTTTQNLAPVKAENTEKSSSSSSSCDLAAASVSVANDTKPVVKREPGNQTTPPGIAAIVNAVGNMTDEN